MDFDVADLEQRLISTLRAVEIERVQQKNFNKGLAEDCRNFLAGLLPLTETEMEFFKQMLDKGEIASALLTADEEMQDRIRRHSLLGWKA